jgi:MIP family channel proteins
MAAEAIGTFALVFAGTGAIVSDSVSGGALGHVGVALTFGLVIMAMVYATGHISGAHFNPAVTLAFALARHFPARRVTPYLLAQITGAILGSLAVRYLIGNAGGLGVTHPTNGAIPGLIFEALLTYLLMFVIMAVATDVRAVGQAAAIAIGGTIALEALFAGPITGASMNPARSLAPAIVAGDYADLWLYIVGPIIGAALGALTYQALRTPAEQSADEAAQQVEDIQPDSVQVQELEGE